MKTEGGLKHDVNTRISQDDLDRLEQAAEREERPKSAILRRALRQYLGQVEDDQVRASLDEQRRNS